MHKKNQASSGSKKIIYPHSKILSGIRIGLGYDVHAFGPNRKLILAGITIPHYQGLDGHSDADVLSHAISDALLGAIRQGDIGKLFPDNDDHFKDACSLDLLHQVSKIVYDKGFSILDIDCVIAAQAPKLSPFRDQMRKNLSNACNLNIENVGLKATTTEHLGFEGREEGISAQAVALLMKNL